MGFLRAKQNKKVPLLFFEGNLFSHKVKNYNYVLDIIFKRILVKIFITIFLIQINIDKKIINFKISIPPFEIKFI